MITRQRLQYLYQVLFPHHGEKRYLQNNGEYRYPRWGAANDKCQWQTVAQNAMQFPLVFLLSRHQ